MSDSTPKKHGGARPGAGRPRSKTKTPSVLVSFRISGDEAVRLQEIATANGDTVNAWCQAVARRALDEGFR